MAEDEQRQFNRLMAAIPDDLRVRLQPHLETVPLIPRTVLAEAGSALSHAYFPHSGVVCLMAPARKGPTEAATIGPEGFIGFEGVLGGTINQRVLVQVAGTASRVPIEVVSDLARESDAFRDLLLAYVRCFMVQVLQSVACNGSHSIQERCARWLLMTHDRAGADRFEMTHQFLGELVGIQRPSVSIAVGSLQDAGLIRWVRGKITILNAWKRQPANATESFAMPWRRTSRNLVKAQALPKAPREHLSIWTDLMAISGRHRGGAGATRWRRAAPEGLAVRRPIIEGDPGTP